MLSKIILASKSKVRKDILDNNNIPNDHTSFEYGLYDKYIISEYNIII